jgi:MFS family permease
VDYPPFYSLAILWFIQLMSLECPLRPAIGARRNKSVADNSTPRPKVSLSQTFSAFQHYNYRLWFMGQLVSLVGTWMQTTAQGYLVYELTHSAAYLGYVGFASGFPSIVFTLFGGVVADRMSRRKLMLITQSTMMILAFVLAALVFTKVIQPWEIIILAFLLGIANAFDAPARQAFVVELVEREDLTNAIALNSTMFNLATVVGPSVAGITYAAFGSGWCFSINGVSFVAVIIALALMRLRPQPQVQHTRSALSEMKEGLVFAYSNVTIRMLLSNLAAISVFAFGVVNLMPAWAVSILGGDVTTNGLLLSARGAGALLGALVVAMWGGAHIRGKMWTMGSFLLPILLFVFAYMRWLPLSLLMLVGVGFGMMVSANTTNALVQLEIPDHLRGRVMGLYTLVFQGGMPVGALIAGSLADGIGEPLTVKLSALVLMLVAILTFILRPSLRRLE